MATPSPATRQPQLCYFKLSVNHSPSVQNGEKQFKMEAATAPMHDQERQAERKRGITSAGRAACLLHSGESLETKGERQAAVHLHFLSLQLLQVPPGVRGSMLTSAAGELVSWLSCSTSTGEASATCFLITPI